MHQIFEDYDNVKFLIAFSDPNQPYTCREWGQMPDGGSSQIISDTNSSIWGLFQSGGAFPSSALLNHEMMVYDKNPSIFALDDIELKFTDDSLVAMSELALKRKTGARGLRSILEKLLLDEMYESPSRKDIEQIIIDKENVTDDIQPKMVLKEKKESKDSKPA